MNDPRFKNAATEAANRAEATALLIRCGYRVYRPEADIEGEDLVLRRADGPLFAVQLKSRLYVDWKRYGGRGLCLLFPSGQYKEGGGRHWYLVAHDELYRRVEDIHGKSDGWSNAWSAAKASPHLREFLDGHVLKPSPEDAEAVSISN